MDLLRGTNNSETIGFLFQTVLYKKQYLLLLQLLLLLLLLMMLLSELINMSQHGLVKEIANKVKTYYYILSDSFENWILISKKNMIFYKNFNLFQFMQLRLLFFIIFYSAPKAIIFISFVNNKLTINVSCQSLAFNYSESHVHTRTNIIALMYKHRHTLMF